MKNDSTKSLSKVIRIDESEIRGHLDKMVREETRGNGVTGNRVRSCINTFFRFCSGMARPLRLELPGGVNHTTSPLGPGVDLQCSNT